MYIVTQLFQLSVTSGQNWLLDLGFRWQEMTFLIKTALNRGIRAISLQKKSVLNRGPPVMHFWQAGYYHKPNT